MRNYFDIPPFKAEIYDCFERAVRAYSVSGPGFGCGSDLVVKDSQRCGSAFGFTYKAPPGFNDYATTGSKSYRLLAGSANFNASEVEVYYLP